LAVAEKDQLYSNTRAIIGNHDSTQSATPIPLIQKAELIQQNIQFSKINCIQSDYSILGLSVQCLASHTCNKSTKNKKPKPNHY